MVGLLKNLIDNVSFLMFNTLGRGRRARILTEPIIITTLLKYGSEKLLIFL